MYRVSESEFLQYDSAEYRLNQTRLENAAELKQAYDNIHPTRVCFNYSRGEVYSESINPIDYAIYLVELKEEHARIETWWEQRALTFREAYRQLTDDEKSIYEHGVYGRQHSVRKKLKGILSTLLDAKPELQRRYISLDQMEDIEEVDRLIDKMTDEELLKDYWDKDEMENECDDSRERAAIST